MTLACDVIVQRTTAAAFALVAVAAFDPPAATAQARSTGPGVFDHAIAAHPFNVLLTGRPGLGVRVSGELANNALDLADLVGVIRIASDEEDGLKPSDLFLIGGHVPAGSGLRLDSRGDVDLVLGLLPTPIGVFGLTAGFRAHADVVLPDEVAGILRDGHAGERLDLPLGGMYGAAFAYGHAGAIGLFELPVHYLDPPMDLRVRVGAGLRRLFGIAYSGIEFRDAHGGSAIGVDHDGVDADLTVVVPTELARPGGGGFAADFFVTADIGRSLYASILVLNLGRIRIDRGERSVSRLELTGGTVREFFERLDSLQTDTITANTETLRLPGTVRAEAGYRVHPRIDLGAAVEVSVGDRFASPALVASVVELRPIRWLPLRLGADARGAGYGKGYTGGLGLHAGRFRWDLEAATQGLGTGSRGGGVRTSFAFLF